VKRVDRKEGRMERWKVGRKEGRVHYNPIYRRRKYEATCILNLGTRWM
jgi:hypothetical protein